MKDNSLVGFKLKPEFEQYSDFIERITSYKPLDHFNLYPSTGNVFNILNDAKLIDIWFERIEFKPVVNDGFKIGDWVTVTKILDEGNFWMNNTPTRTYVLKALPTKYLRATAWTCVNPRTRECGGLIAEFRLATTEEILGELNNPNYR